MNTSRVAKLLVAVALFTGWMLLPGGAEAAGGDFEGPNFRISGGSDTGHEWFPSVAYNSTDDEYLVVGQDGSGDVIGQRIAPDGRRLGEMFGISGNRAVGVSVPAVVHNPVDSEYLVVWWDARRAKGGDGDPTGDIFAQRIAADGSRIGWNLRISGKEITWRWDPDLVHNVVRNEYLVVWEDGSRDIVGQRLFSNGERIGRRIPVSEADSVQAAYPAIAHDAAHNRYLVVWEDFRNYGVSGWDVYGQQIAAKGRLVDANFRISGAAATAGDQYPGVGFNTNRNQFLVFWHDERRDRQIGADVYGQRLSAKAERLGGNFRLTNDTTKSNGCCQAASVAYNPTSDQYLALVAPIDQTGHVYGQRIRANGKRLGAAFRISGPNADVFGYGSNAATCHPLLNEYLAVWADARNVDTRGIDIYGRRVTGAAP